MPDNPLPPNTAKVFLVEDSISDIVLTKAILKTQKIHFSMQVFRDGSEVITALETLDDSETPDLMLLDVNLPKVSGNGVLSYLRSNERHGHLPVVMFSGSDAPADKENAKILGARHFMVKPLDKTKLSEAVGGIESLIFEQDIDSWYLRRRPSDAA